MYIPSGMFAIITSLMCTQEENVSVSDDMKKVSFNSSISSKVAAVLEQMKERLKRGSQQKEEEEEQEDVQVE